MPDNAHRPVEESYSSGLRTTLRENATAYGYSVTITATFGITATQHAQYAGPIQVLLFAAGAAAAFLLTEAVASRFFRRAGDPEQPLTSMLAGAVDVLSILSAVAAGSVLAYIPTEVGWAAASFGATAVYLLVGAVDVLVARYFAHRAD